MAHLRKLLPLALFLFVALESPTSAQTPVQPAIAPAIPQLQYLTRNSGYIFSGTVLNIEPIAAGANEITTMRITFRVDRGLRGARAGQILVIREWAGLWQSGERYRRGERVYLFLYPTSKLGLTSPVSGVSGRFTLDRDGSVVLPPPHFQWHDG